MVYAICFGACLNILVAWQAFRSMRGSRSYYAQEVYGMSRASHRRVAIVACAAVVLSLCGGLMPSIVFTAMLAVETVAALLYLASFARGASYEEDR